MPPGKSPLPLRHAIALGLAQGPTELLPVSSSAHAELIPWLAGWPHAELDAELRKSFEVALHAGGGLALAIAMRGELRDAIRDLERRRAVVIALSLAPPALAGCTLRGGIERLLGGPRSIAAGLTLGAAAMALADALPGRGGASVRDGPAARGTRAARDARPADGLALGLAQALALAPGVSRNGATLTAARARGFARGDAQVLSWRAGLPVILGASALEAQRVARRGVPSRLRAPLAAGASGAFLSTLLSARLLRRGERSGRALLPYAIYRCLLAALVLRRLASAHNRSR
jgi:undecaprenyl-diphosphatase